MKRKGWLIPILVFFISIGFLFFYQKIQNTDSFADTTTMPPILWSESSSDITKVIFKQASHKIEVSRSGDEWFLSTPLTDKADALYVYNVISAFTEPMFEQVIEISPTNLTNYGIDELSTTITLYDQDQHEYVLIKGNSVNELSDYVYSPMSDTVYTMPKTAFQNISTDITKWRNKELLSFNKSDVKKINISYNNNSYVLLPTVENGNISFSNPKLQSNFISSFISLLETAKIQNFVTDEADATILDAYGFSNPSLKTTIYLKSGSTLSLTFGSTLKDENICYIKRGESSSIVTIPYLDLSSLNVIYSTPDIEKIEKEDSLGKN